MSSPLPLLKVSLEFKIMVLEADEGTAVDLEFGWAEAGLTVRRVRGKKAHLSGIVREFGAALQFPYYFGENSGAFDEC